MAKTSVAQIQKGPAEKTRKFSQENEGLLLDTYRVISYPPLPIHVSKGKWILDAINTHLMGIFFFKGQTHNSAISCIEDGRLNEKAKTPSTIRWIKTLICL